MTVNIINPKNGSILQQSSDNCYVDSTGCCFPIVRNVLRISSLQNYTANFALQWNKFSETQLDRNQLDASKTRFFAETHWNRENLDNQNILEVGSGAGRFSKVILEYTHAILWSVDYSDAVTANYINNGFIAPERFHLFQASIYELPFPDNSFDKVFCMGVLQHTPDFEASIKALVDKAKPGGEIVVDFYPIKGWWTKLHAKYLLHPFLKHINHKLLLKIIEANIGWLMKTEYALHRIGLGFFARFLPIVDIQGTIPKTLSAKEKKEWVILDTFDMFSPEYDNPQRIKNVAQMFERQGAQVTFAGFEYFDGGNAAVVRAVKRKKEINFLCAE